MEESRREDMAALKDRRQSVVAAAANEDAQLGASVGVDETKATEEEEEREEPPPKRQELPRYRDTSMKSTTA